MFWYDKRYHSFNYFLRNTFGEKLLKLCFDAGFTCPNRDGTKSYDGCIFCSQNGSGDFASDRNKSIYEQYEYAKNIKTKVCIDQKYIAYFQAFTNTYSSIKTLEQKYREVLQIEDIAVLSIATRPDCINEDIVILINNLSSEYQKPIFVELGLQTSNADTIKLINRQYENIDFEIACIILNKYNIDIICHIILGLPFEEKHHMLETVKYACSNNINGLKLQLLHIIENTMLAEMYKKNVFTTLTQEEYIDIIVSCLEIIPQNIVIHRLTGDGPKELLIAPLWSKNKKNVINSIDKELKSRNTFQGKSLKEF